ncbi:class F sortase [Streptomyces sp. enrichment culture]|uniref:class F sortase n=1 Tax=Streptomyces sp. enrichment culture TaxID=1795815 RepID=UPI003F57FC0D
MAEQERSPSSGAGRLLAGVAWLVLLLGLWLWGREVTDVPSGATGPTTGDMAAAGRPPRVELPPAHRPLGDAPPRRLDIPDLGVRAPVVARGLDERGAPDPPPFDLPGAVGWYADGVAPGAAGTALMVGHVDTETRPAVFHEVDTLRPGQRIGVVRADGRVAEFTVEDVQVLDRDRFDARRAYGPRRAGRAELRLVTCGGSFDRASGGYTANVVVSAYLTGTTTGAPAGRATEALAGTVTAPTR